MAIVINLVHETHTTSSSQCSASFLFRIWINLEIKFLYFADGSIQFGQLHNLPNLGSLLSYCISFIIIILGFDERATLQLQKLYLRALFVKTSLSLADKGPWMINCFCGMVDWQKMFSLISSWDHCPRSSPSQIFDMPRTGFELAQNLSLGFVEWSCATVKITTPRTMEMFVELLLYHHKKT